MQLNIFHIIFYYIFLLLDLLNNLFITFLNIDIKSELTKFGIKYFAYNFELTKFGIKYFSYNFYKY